MSPNQCLWGMQYKKQRDETYSGLIMMKPPWREAVCYLGNTTERNKHSNIRDGPNKPLQVTVEVSVTLFLCLGFGWRCSMPVHLPWSPWTKKDPSSCGHMESHLSPLPREGCAGSWASATGDLEDGLRGMCWQEKWQCSSLYTCVIFPSSLGPLLCCFPLSFLS